MNEVKTKSEYTGLVPAVDQASKVLLCLAKNPSSKMNLTEICKSVGIHKSKGHSILNTFKKFGFVHKDAVEKTYSLGLGLITLARRVLDDLNFNEIVAPFLEALANQVKSTALFAIIDGNSVFVVKKEEAGSQIGITARVGHRFHLSHGAHGKAIAAFMSDDELKKLLEQNDLFFHGYSVKFDPERLNNEIQECRKKGFAFDMGDLNSGINVIASPVFDSRQKTIGSIMLVGTFPESNVEEFGSMVVDTARRVSLMLGANIDKTYNRFPTVSVQ